MAFDPDKYLASNAQTFNPDAYLGQSAPKSDELTWENIKQGAMNIPASLLINTAKPFYGLNQAAWQLAGKVAPSVANMGDYPVELLNRRQAALNKEAGPASKFTTEPAALIGENIGPTAIANRVMAAKNMIPSFSNMLATNTALGAGTAFANPEKTGLTPEEFGREKTKSMAIGAAVPAAVTLGGGALANTISPQFTKEAQNLINKGVNLTPGQRMGGMLKSLEDKLTSYPIVGGMIEAGRRKSIEGFDKAAFKQVLEPINGVVPKEAGREGMQVVEQQVKAAYNELLPKLNFSATPDFKANMAQLTNLADGLPNNLGDTFKKNIQQIIGTRLGPQGTMDGTDFKKVESELSKKAKAYGKSIIASEQDLGDAYKQALVNLRTALAESNPSQAKELAKTNAAFARLSIVRDAASKANTQDMFSPAQLAAAVRKADESAGKNRSATGTALMQDLSDAAVSTLPSKVPDSGTVGRGNIASPFGWATGALASIPYSLADVGLTNRPEIVRKLIDSLRGKSAYATGPAVNKALGESNE
jgi:hypothetical protein